MATHPKKILITGMAGFVGSHMADFLLKNTDCRIFGFKEINSHFRNIRHLLDKTTIIEGDLIDQNSVTRALKISEPDQIYHFGALSWVAPSWKMPAAYMQVNGIGTINIFEAMRTIGCKPRLLISCTVEEYGDVPKELLPIIETTRIFPVNPYAASKVAQDAVCQAYFASYGFEVIRTRAFNHEGPRRDILGALASFAHQIARIEKGLQEPVIKVGNLEARRDFTDVRDMVRAYHLAMEKGTPGELYNIGSNQVYQIEECLKMLIALSPMKGKIRYEVDPERIRPSELRALIGDFSKFKKLTGWEPQITFEKTLQDILDYWREFVDKGYY